MPRIKSEGIYTARSEELYSQRQREVHDKQTDNGFVSFPRQIESAHADVANDLEELGIDDEIQSSTRIAAQMHFSYHRSTQAVYSGRTANNKSNKALL